jgi:hypothetical protein
MKIHIEGWLPISLSEKLSDNNDLDARFEYEDESAEVIRNCKITIYTSPNECTLEEAMSGHIKQMLGQLILVGQAYGYSEYTIEGFNVNEARIGGHNLDEELKQMSGYAHIIIEKTEL